MTYTARNAPLLFLDIDGPLSYGTSGDMRALGAFNQWLKINPEILIVVCSQWRLYMDRRSLARALEIPCGERIIGVTPDLSGHDFGDDFLFLRERECISWRNGFGHQGRFAALDDMPELYSPECSFLVVSPRSTITPETLRAVETALGLPHRVERAEQVAA